MSMVRRRGDGLFGRKGDMIRLQSNLTKELKQAVASPRIQFHHHHLGLLNHFGGCRHNEKHRILDFVDVMEEDIIETEVHRETNKCVNIMVGHSLGGALSCYLAARHPELVQGLCLLDILPPCAVSTSDVSQMKFSSKAIDDRPFSILILLRVLRVFELFIKCLPRQITNQYFPHGTAVDELLLKAPFGWKDMHQMGRRYVLRGYMNQKSDHIFDFNVRPLLKFFKQRQSMSWDDLRQYDQPIMIVKAKDSGFTPYERIEASKQELDTLNVKEIHGGHWLLGNSSQIKAVVEVLAPWIRDDILAKL